MAYGNWGAYVYKNGKRQENREDNTPYKEDELTAGYIQAFGSQNTNPVHASLGSGDIRLCGYKDYARLYWKGEQIDLDPYIKDEENGIIEGELHGYKFKAYHSDSPSAVNLELTEPDGTYWTGKSGYCMGAGHD